MSALVVMPLLSACQTQEQTGALVGAGGGALAGGLIGGAIGGRGGAAIGAILGGAAGLFAGSMIGRQLDEQDRARAEAATRRVLDEPVYYPSPVATSAPPPRPVSWSSAKNGGPRGLAQVTSVSKNADGGECRVVRETAYIQGREVMQDTRYCRGRGGQWQGV
jgi:surface antigen